jgi:hypothetical protein
VTVGRELYAISPPLRNPCLVPQTVGRRQEVVDSPELGALPWLWERPGRRRGAREQDHGVSVVRTSRWKTAAGEGQERPVRVLGVASTPLAKAQAPRAAAARQAERAVRVTLQHQWQRRTLACEADAHQAATLGLQELSLHRHHLTYTVGAAWVTDKRPTRGRPPKTAPRPQRRVWRVIWQMHAATELITARTRRDSRVVCATSVLEAEHLLEAELLRASKGQPAAELRFTWAKNPAAIAPIFLETPTRLAALGCVDMIALLLYTLVERHVRNSLAARGATLPDRPAPSPRLTARTVFQLMRNIALVTLVGAGQRHRQVTTLNAVQVHVLSLLGDASAI